MRVILIDAGGISVLSYQAMMFLSVILAVGTLACRVRNRSLDQKVLAVTLLASLVAGWFGTRLVTGLSGAGLSEASLGLLVPTRHVGMSFTIFMVFALPVLFLGFRLGRVRMLPYLDAIAPSIFLALALAKAGCFLAGCCAGDVCPTNWGVRYPYGSKPYQLHVAEERISPPATLLREDGAVGERLFGHIDFLKAVANAPPKELTEHAARHGLAYADLVKLAGTERSLPVWPVPLWYAAASGVLWAVAEVTFRRSKRPGYALALVLLGYPGMRLVLDGFRPAADHTFAFLSAPQLAALLPLAGGIALLFFLAAPRRGFR